MHRPVLDPTGSGNLLLGRGRASPREWGEREKERGKVKEKTRVSEIDLLDKWMTIDKASRMLQNKSSHHLKPWIA